MPRLLILLVALALTTGSASADTLANVKTALGRLTATQPVRATYAARDEMKSSGRFDNNQSERDAAFEVGHDGRRVTVTIPDTLVARAGIEAKAAGAREQPARSAIRAVRPLDIVEALDFRDPLLGLLAVGKVLEEKRGIWSGRSARILVLKLTQPEIRSSGEVRLGKSTREEDRLTLWLGDEDIPFAAERYTRTKGGFLVFRFEAVNRIQYTFARLGDRILLTRREESGAVSGIGQNIDTTSVTTLTVH